MSSRPPDRPNEVASNLHLREMAGMPYEREELGAVHQAGAPDVLAALSLPSRGEIYDLDSGRWSGMPVVPFHPPFILSSYRTPRGRRNQDDTAEWFGPNLPNLGVNSELMVGTSHTGTHVDALNHITCGVDSHWGGGYDEDRFMGDFGTLRAEASSIAPFICRGVLVDVAGHLGVDILESGHLITLDEAQAALARQGTEIRRGDAVLVRTGYMQVWDGAPDVAARHHGSGIALDVAREWADLGVVLVGADNESLERNPSPDPDHPHPVHADLLVERGVHIAELLYLEDLARDRVHEFLFVCLPLRLRGATASMVRPVAII
jgi:kynurenine formamidase